MVEGVGLAMANGVGEATARIPCGPGIAQAVSAMASIAQAASGPLILPSSRPAARPGGVMVFAKTASQFYDRQGGPASSFQSSLRVASPVRSHR